MAATLFELYATLGLDTTDFADQAEAAVDKGDEMAEEVADAFKKADEKAEDADSKLNDLKGKSSTTSAILDGFLSVTAEVVEEVITRIIDFGAESIELASKTGSELAESYLAAQDRLVVSTEALKLKVGNVLLPIATVFSDLASDLMGITDADRLMVMLNQIDSYAFDNIEGLRNNLSAVFGQFEKVEAGGQQDIGDMLSGLQSQAEYWQQYADTIEALKQRNVDTSFLASIADGSVESFETLKALENADEADLTNLLDQFNAVETARESVAQGLSDIQLAVDEDFQSMKNSVDTLVQNMSSEDAYNATHTFGSNMADGLAAAYPSIASWVDAINEKLATLGAGFNPGYTMQDALNQGFVANEMGFSFWTPHASGISYVPYDGYRAELHAGEKVLTRQQAESDRRGETGAGADPQAIAAAIASALNGAAVQMDGKTVGSLVTAEVSKGIARQSRASRRYV